MSRRVSLDEMGIVAHTVNVTNIAVLIHAFMVPPILNEMRRSPLTMSTSFEGLS
jgi:hypothetical protein